MSVIPRINWIPEWIRRTAAVPEIETEGLESEIAAKLSLDDNEFLACSVLRERKHLPVLAALLSRNEINKVSVAAYLNPRLPSDSKSTWIAHAQKEDRNLAQVLAELGPKVAQIVNSNAPQRTYDLFHSAMTGIMAYLTKYSTDSSLRRVAVSPPGWEGTVRQMKEDDGVDNPWALSWWMKSKGYKPSKQKKKKS